MSNDFFNDHEFLGGMFDFDGDGSLDIGEAAFMGGLGMMILDEDERESNAFDDSDDYDDEDW